jgi:hypothetical protein
MFSFRIIGLPFRIVFLPVRANEAQLPESAKVVSLPLIEDPAFLNVLSGVLFALPIVSLLLAFCAGLGVLGH